MKKKIPAYILAMAAVCLVGCAVDGQNQSVTDNTSSVVQSESESSDTESSVSDESSDNESTDSEGTESTESSPESAPEAEGIHLSVCKVPSWGIIDGEGSFKAGSEYETYRVLRTITFEGESAKEIKTEVYVVSEDFDMDAFEEKWGFKPVWNGEFYEGSENIPEEYSGMTVEEIKLKFAEPVLKKYGAESLDGLFEVVFVDPTIPPDPAIDF